MFPAQSLWNSAACVRHAAVRNCHLILRPVSSPDLLGSLQPVRLVTERHTRTCCLAFATFGAYLGNLKHRTFAAHAGGATLIKVFLYVLCKALAKRSASAMALAEDHRNDIMSNSVAIVTAAIATEFRSVPALSASTRIVTLLRCADMKRTQTTS